jgi:hypothetical protein
MSQKKDVRKKVGKKETYVLDYFFLVSVLSPFRRRIAEPPPPQWRTPSAVVGFSPKVSVPNPPGDVFFMYVEVGAAQKVSGWVGQPRD